ncbi:MAG: aminoacyl-tRNA hydrolase [Alphaproteobacteria bacterium]
MYLLVGLGNPGPKYKKNRHNIGFMAVDEIVRRHSFSEWRGRFQGQVSEGRLNGEKILALKPETYMNNSGQAVGEAMRFFKLTPDDVYVVFDELDLALGKLRVKQGGGTSGHNGLKSIDAHIGKDYWKLRIGIGHPGDKEKVLGHVLGDFSKSETETVEAMIDAISRSIPDLFGADAPTFMSKVALVLKPPAHQPKPGTAPVVKQPAAKQPAGKKSIIQDARTALQAAFSKARKGTDEGEN